MTERIWLILGLGYSATRLARHLSDRGVRVIGVRRQALDDVLAFTDPTIPGLIERVDVVLSSVPPDPSHGRDPVLDRFADPLATTRARLVYLSSTGVYGDAGGAVVDETAPIGHGRRTARAVADRAWLDLGALVVRLPGIYGPGRSALDQVRAGTARRIDRPGHRFNRIHVDDIAGGVIALVEAGAVGPFNLVDEWPAEPRAVTEEACRLLGAPLPPLEPFDPATLSPAAQGFWAERRIVAGTKLARATGYRLRHPDYKAGLRAILEEEGR
ncbi:MAG: SDR family NAD(P)-dependent oxidoreductase [Sphingomonadaceae bacterium]|uniref:SDR family NAD(P)-dependent oxidoreductase n=1 Tax=Thermaurantiacus sp. TaxID=2820283 RepID=UPI00298F2EEE|nr:SDR family NAD(P)-dependent oxidoreductase [Thermaurantiacus sp.]MCS6986058.1 SDR family NAD(P)-dependent oxidoreductase [Sphingomonadaceae bacterium]MDW8414726.1 SDR family NAD(P)-dependent oxidoreductase [Thermaurantiacus sp.]